MKGQVGNLGSPLLCAAPWLASAALLACAAVAGIVAYPRVEVALAQQDLDRARASALESASEESAWSDFARQGGHAGIDALRAELDASLAPELPSYLIHGLVRALATHVALDLDTLTVGDPEQPTLAVPRVWARQIRATGVGRAGSSADLAACFDELGLPVGIVEAQVTHSATGAWDQTLVLELYQAAPPGSAELETSPVEGAGPSTVPGADA